MDAWEIWNIGKPLERAHLHFGPQDKIKALRDHAEENSPVKMIDRLQTNLESGKDFIAALKGATDVKKISAQTKLRDEVRQAILRHLHSGDIKAYGFEAPRRASDAPIAVPSDLWRGWVRWDKSMIEAQSLRIENVRLVPAHLIKTETPVPTLEPASDKEPPRPAGRPSRALQIIEAFEALDSEGKIDFSNPAKHCYPAVRNWVKINYPEAENPDRGLSDKAIQLHVNPLFNARKDRD